MGGKYSLVGGKQALFYPKYILNPPKNIEQFYCQGFLQSGLGVEYRQSRCSITRHSSLLKSGTYIYHSATGLPAAHLVPADMFLLVVADVASSHEKDRRSTFKRSMKKPLCLVYLFIFQNCTEVASLETI